MSGLRSFSRQDRKILARKAGSYGFVSLVCFVTNNILLVVLDSMGQPLWSTLAISAFSMIVLGFTLQSVLTFGAPLSWPAFGRYTLMMLPNIPLAYGLLWVLSGPLALPMLYSAPIATTIMLLWNAAGSAWALHRRSEAPNRRC